MGTSAMFEPSVHAKAIELTKISLRMTAEAGSGHPTSAASLAHLVTLLMYQHMRYDPARPARRGSDRLVLSEGHACPIVYAAAANLGVRIGRGEGRPMTLDDAMRLREIDSEIDGHPNPAEGFPFFPAATGSLGQGLSIALGHALAGRVDNRDYRVYAMIGDGEADEGQIWEATMAAAKYNVSNLTAILDYNKFQQTGPVDDVMPVLHPMVDKWRTFGWYAFEINGHDMDQILDAFNAALQVRDRPQMIIAHTLKGRGLSPFEADDENRMHGKPLDDGALEIALAELDELEASLGGKS